MNIKWYGHSSFLLTDSEGTSILTDPCPPEVGYELKDIECDAITVSHKHFDHCYVQCAVGEPLIIDTVGTRMVKNIRVTGYPDHRGKGSAVREGILASEGEEGKGPSSVSVETLAGAGHAFCGLGSCRTCPA